MQVHLPARVQDKIETGRHKNKTYFIDICNKLTLHLLPSLLVHEQDGVLYSVAFEEDLCLGNECDWKEGLGPRTRKWEMWNAVLGPRKLW